MNKTFKLYLFVAFVSINFFLSPTFACEGILQFAGRNFNKSENFYLKSSEMRDSYCDGESTKVGIDLKSFSEAAVGMPAPSGTAFGSIEHARNFCKNYFSAESIIQRQNSFDSTVVESSVKSYVQCMELTRKTIEIKVDKGPKQLVVQLNRARDNFFFRGVKLASDADATCKYSIVSNEGSGTKIVQTTKDATTDTNLPYFVSSSQNITIVCNRPEKTNDKGYSYFSAVELTVDTDRGSLPLLWGRDYKYGPEYSTELSKELDKLKLADEANKDALKRIKETIESLSSRAPLFLKSGNSGAVSCQRYCTGSEWPPAYQTCLMGFVNLNGTTPQMIPCSQDYRTTGMDLTCICKS